MEQLNSLLIIGAFRRPWCLPRWQWWSFDGWKSGHWYCKLGYVFSIFFKFFLTNFRSSKLFQKVKAVPDQISLEFTPEYHNTELGSIKIKLFTNCTNNKQTAIAKLISYRFDHDLITSLTSYVNVNLYAKSTTSSLSPPHNNNTTSKNKSVSQIRLHLLPSILFYVIYNITIQSFQISWKIISVGVRNTKS